MRFASVRASARSRRPASPNLPAVSVYESFFRTVVERGRTVSSPAAPIAVPPTIQAALGLTDQEMQSLNVIAADCESRVSAIRQSGSHLIFDARLEAIETGQTPVKAMQQLKEMDVRIGRLMEQSTQQLKSALGEAAFQKLDGWLRAGGANQCFVAPCAARR